VNPQRPSGWLGSDVVLRRHGHHRRRRADRGEGPFAYLDAFVPENGKSLFDYLPAEQSGQMRAAAAAGFALTM
jgi:hypothetical protein